MSKNQLHGLTFESAIIGSGRFPGAPVKEDKRAVFDIDARFDRQDGYPTSVKATSNNVVALADARRIWSYNSTIRIIVGQYMQVGATKRFTSIHEFILDPESLDRLRGDLTFDQVEAFHDGLALEFFPEGEHAKGRAWARARNKVLRQNASLIALNPKIGSGNQRRLQCSVTLANLRSACASATGRYSQFTTRFGDLALPYLVDSSARVFGK